MIFLKPTTTTTYFITITFDLHDCNNYDSIEEELKKRGYLKEFEGADLPDNIYVKTVEVQQSKSMEEITESVEKELEKLFGIENVGGKFFVLVSRQWSGKIGVINVN